MNIQNTPISMLDDVWSGYEAAWFFFLSLAGYDYLHACFSIQLPGQYFIFYGVGE